MHSSNVFIRNSFCNWFSSLLLTRRQSSEFFFCISSFRRSRFECNKMTKWVITCRESHDACQWAIVTLALLASNAIRLLCIEWFHRSCILRSSRASFVRCNHYNMHLFAVFADRIVAFHHLWLVKLPRSQTFDFNLCVIFERNNVIGDEHSDKKNYLSCT